MIRKWENEVQITSDKKQTGFHTFNTNETKMQIINCAQSEVHCEEKQKKRFLEMLEIYWY